MYTHSITGLHLLTFLEMDKNKINMIEIGAFSDLKQLETLWLNWNNLQMLDLGIFDMSDHPTSLHNFIIYNNPIQCSTNLCWIKVQWLSRILIQVFHGFI